MFNAFKDQGPQLDALSMIQGGRVQVQMDLEKLDESIVVHIKAPTVKQENFSVEIHGKTLSIVVMNVLRYDTTAVVVPFFMRGLEIPGFVKADEISAVHQVGGVDITLPFRDDMGSRRIEIKELY